MANTLKPKRSSVAGNIPTTTNLTSGEMGVNMADQKIWINNGTSVVQIGSGRLSGLADVVLSSLATGQGLSWNGTNWVNSSAGSGTVTSVSGTGTVSGLTLSGTVTGSGSLTLSGAITGFLPTSGGTLTGPLIFGNATSPNTQTVQFGDNTGWTLRYMTSVSGTPTERFRFVDTGAFNAGGAITQAGNQVLHAGNFTSYSPSLTGSGASGTWGINVTGSSASTTGNAATATALQTARTINGVSFNGTANITITAAANGGTAANITGQANSATITASTGVNASQIVQRDGNGYIYANHINFSTTENENPTISSFITSNGDGWSRKSNLQHVKNSIRGVADGTWSINVTGSAGSVAWSGVSSRPSNIMYYQSFTLDANTMDSNSTGFTYAVNAPAVGPVARFSAGGGYDLWLNAPYSGGGNDLYFRTRNGDNGTLNAWRTVLHSGNFTSYSPSLTGAGASGTWNISITGSVASSNAVNGLTLTSSANGINPDNVTQNQLGYNTSVSLFGQTDGGLYSSAYSSSWIHQIYGDFRTGQIATRGKNSGTWQAWRVQLDSGNFSSYALPLSGGTIAGNGFIDFGPNSGWGATLRVGGNGHGGATRASVATTNGNLHLDGTTNSGVYLNWYNSGTAGAFFGNGAGGQVGRVDGGGNATFSGNVSGASDERLKTDWEALPADYIERLAKVKSGTYTRLDSGARQAGASAQDMQKLLKETVMTADDEAGTLSLAYGNAALVSAIELAKDNVDLRARVAKLEALVSKLIEG